MPEVAFTGSWMKSAHKLWVKRLRRTSSLPELLQVSRRFSDLLIYMLTSELSLHFKYILFLLCLFLYNGNDPCRFLLTLLGQWMRIGCTRVHRL
jgi:hypothetical protein